MQTTESIISLYLILKLLCSALKIISSFVCVSSQPYCYSTQVQYVQILYLYSTQVYMLGYMLERNLQVCADVAPFLKQQNIFLSAFKRRRKCGNNFPKSLMEYSWFIHFSFWTTPPWLAEEKLQKQRVGSSFSVCLSKLWSFVLWETSQAASARIFFLLPSTSSFIPTSSSPSSLSFMWIKAWKMTSLLINRYRKSSYVIYLLSAPD